MDNMQLAQRIKNKCKEKDIAINRMLIDCGLSKSFVYDLEKRSSFPSCDRIFRIAKYLNCSADYLLGLEDIEEKKGTNSKIITLENKNQTEMLDMFNKLNEEYQKKALSNILELVIEMSQKQDEETNKNRAYIAALGGGVFEIDDETAKFIEENAVFQKYKPKRL